MLFTRIMNTWSGLYVLSVEGEDTHGAWLKDLEQWTKVLLCSFPLALSVICAAGSLHKQFGHYFLQFYMQSQNMGHRKTGSDISEGTPVPAWVKQEPLVSAFTPRKRQSGPWRWRVRCLLSCLSAQHLKLRVLKSHDSSVWAQCLNGS